MFSVFFFKKNKKSFEKGVDICVVVVYNVYKERKRGTQNGKENI